MTSRLTDLPELTATLEPELRHDGSTDALIRRYRKAVLPGQRGVGAGKI